MGTLKEEMSKVKAVLNEWDKQDEQSTQPQEKTMQKKHTTVSKLLEFIERYPGINSVELRKQVTAKYPEIVESHISSMLKQLTDSYQLSRVEVQSEMGRNTFNYTIIPESERAALKVAEKARYEAAVARAEKARAVKEAKAKERQLGISDLVPEKVVAPTPVSKSTWTAKEALEGLNILQARELYDELKKIFGG